MNAASTPKIRVYRAEPGCWRMFCPADRMGLQTDEWAKALAAANTHLEDHGEEASRPS